MKRIEFFCESKPQPQGSSSAFIVGNRAVVTSANKKLKPFRKELAQAAAIAIADAKMPCPVFGKHVALRVYLWFTFLRPKSVPKHRAYPFVKPDLDKLVRGVCDALTDLVWHDDAQVVTILTEKRYKEVEGVRVIVEEE